MLTQLVLMWQLSWRHPVVPRVIVAAFLIGALGGTIPTGFLVLSSGAGLGRGITWGLWAFAFTSPFVVAYAVSALCAARYEWQADTDLFLAGQPSAVTLARDGLSATSVAVLLMVPAALGGMIVGIADAAARHTTLLTPMTAQAPLAALAATCWWSLLAVLVVGAVRSATLGFFVVCGFFLAAIAALGIADAQITWDILSVSPFGPFTLVGAKVAGGRSGLMTHEALVAIGCVAWPVAIGWLVLRRQRGLVPRAPTGSATN